MAVGQACAYCASPGSVKRCAFCREVAYCSPGCQQAHWREGHKRACSRLFTPSAPSKPAAPPKNPCANCGKEGTKQLGGQWFCSHDCTGGNLDSLTQKVKRLASPPQLPPTGDDDKRIMDWLKGNIGGAQPTASDVAAPATPKPEFGSSGLERKQEAPRSESQPGQRRDDQSTLDNVRSLLAAAPQAPLLESQAQPCRDGQSTLDNLKSLLASESQPKPRRDGQSTLENVRSLLAVAPQVAPSTESQPDSDEVDQATLDKVKSLLAAPQVPAVDVLQGFQQEPAPRDDRNTLDKVQELIRNADGVASAQNESPEVFDKVKGLIQGAGTTEVKSEMVESQFTAKENQRVADWIKGICSQTPEENYAAAKKQADAARKAQTLQQPQMAIATDRGQAPTAEAPEITILPKRGQEPKAQTPEITIFPKKGQAPKDGKAKKSKQKPEKQEEVYTDEVSKQLKEIEDKKEELRRANIELEKAKEKQAQMNHYMRGWLQKEAAKQAEADEDAEDINELD